MDYDFEVEQFLMEQAEIELEKKQGTKIWDYKDSNPIGLTRFVEMLSDYTDRRNVSSKVYQFATSGDRKIFKFLKFLKSNNGHSFDVYEWVQFPKCEIDLPYDLEVSHKGKNTFRVWDLEQLDHAFVEFTIQEMFG